MKRSWGAPLLLAALGMVAAGCAQERAPINRIQAGAVGKAFFVGEDLDDPSDDPEFYWRNYVVDASESQSLVGVGSYSGIDRVRWEITENWLFARRAYQFKEGADDKGAHPEKYPNGTIVAAYAIQSHFDIRREYNPSTGEELNVVVENTSDQAWYEREYMRVDWSQNLADSTMWHSMFIGKMFGDIEVTPTEYFNNDPNDPNAIHFEPDQGYFDVTNKFSVAPTMSRLIPGVPTCHLVGFFTGSSTYECEPQEAVVRSSFVKVDPNADFEPLEMTKAPADIVGNPAGLSLGGLLLGLAAPGKQGWDPGYGYTDALYHRFAQIHNLWEASHIEAACTSDVDSEADGTADQCHPSITGYAGSLGSQCDVHVGKCTIPYRDRTVRTVPYYVNPEMPAELQDPLDASGNPTARGAAEDVIHGWNQLMQNAVGYAREVECRRTGGEREACHAQFFAPERQMVSYGGWLVDDALDETEVLTMCHNPVRSYDHESCGEVGYRARLGDVRKNFMAYWPYASRAQYGGIGNWGADPLTGEIHGAAAMIMGRSATHAAAFQRDVIQLAMGDLSLEDILEGVPSETYAGYLKDGAPAQALSNEELARRVASVDAEHVHAEVLPSSMGSDLPQQMLSLAQAEAGSMPDLAALGSSQLEFEAAAGELKGSLYEAHLVQGQWLTSVAAMSPNDSADEVMETVSPLRGLDPGTLRIAEERIETLMHAKGICFSDQHAPALGSSMMQGLAEYYRNKYPSPEYTAEQRGELIYQDLWKEAFKGIAIHEVGHSLGLLHNFASSWDSANYHPGYWQLRTQEGAAAASCNGEPRTGDVEDDTCMGPRYLDPATADERGLGTEPRPGIDYYANTSVMEYSLERFGETIGLGQYDAHAMKALYGRVLETMEDADHGGFAPDEQASFMPRMMSQLAEQDRVTRGDGFPVGQVFPKPTHYTELARKLRLYDGARCREATEEEKAQAGWRLVHGRVCAPIQRDHAAWKDFVEASVFAGWQDADAPAVKTSPAAGTGGDRVRWFYRYGSSPGSYYHTNWSDAGADAYEVTKNTIEMFDARYPWTYFRNGNREYFHPSLPFAASSRTFNVLRAYHWNAANRTALYQGFGPATYEPIAESDDWHRPALVATTEMFNALARYILAPEPGDYGQWSSQPVDSGRPIYDIESSTASFTVDIPMARFIGDEFDSSAEGGGSWNYHHWMKHAGFGVEKIYATMALADGRPVLSTINRANYLDGRATKINFRSDMP
ncbi:MAG: zinc-dependent metalloprotease, partial [Myxococcales bacterium]|nr:zinc-dependent metalloprotease [Myxococcales bacterium]